MCTGVTTPALKSIIQNLDIFNDCLERLSLREVLIWAMSLPNISQVTSFGASGMVMIHEFFDILHATLPVIFIDTLHHFPETLEFVERVADRYSCEVNKYHCNFADTQEDFEIAVGDKELWKNNSNLYDSFVKVEPLERALNDTDTQVWVTGRRRDQGGLRSNMKILEADEGRLKINPLAFWTNAKVWEYLIANQVISNPLYHAGYKSIGDKMTTRPVENGADERSGRFYQIPEKTECGIHNRPKNFKKKKPLTNTSINPTPLVLTN